MKKNMKSPRDHGCDNGGSGSADGDSGDSNDGSN
jgi:hypothetical protein